MVIVVKVVEWSYFPIAMPWFHALDKILSMLACFLQVGFHIFIARITIYPIVIEKKNLLFFLPFLNYLEICMIEEDMIEMVFFIDQLKKIF